MNSRSSLQEFSNFGKTSIRMLLQPMFLFTMLLTSGHICCDNILLRQHSVAHYYNIDILNLNPNARQILLFARPIIPVRFHHHSSIKRLIPSYQQQEVFFCLHYILLNIILRIQNTEFSSQLGLPFILPWIRLLKMVVHVKWTQLLEHDSKLNDIANCMGKESMLGHIPVKSISNNSKVLE